MSRRVDWLNGRAVFPVRAAARRGETAFGRVLGCQNAGMRAVVPQRDVTLGYFFPSRDFRTRSPSNGILLYLPLPAWMARKNTHK